MWGPGWCRGFLDGVLLWQGSHRLPPPPGIDKLTEKSQVSEDGTLRSLEPAPQQSSAEGSPATEVGTQDSWSRRAWAFPFSLSSECGPGQGPLGSPAAEGQVPCAQGIRAGTADSRGVGGLSRTPPLFIGHGLKPLAFKVLIHQPYLRPGWPLPSLPSQPLALNLSLAWAGLGKAWGPGQRVLGWAIPSCGSEPPSPPAWASGEASWPCLFQTVGGSGKRSCPPPPPHTLSLHPSPSCLPPHPRPGAQPSVAGAAATIERISQWAVEPDIGVGEVWADGTKAGLRGARSWE